MVSFKSVLYCLVCSGAYLLVLSLLLDYAERRMRLASGIPSHMIESITIGWSLVNFVMESLFYVAIPTIIYSFVYFLIPFSGLRAGIAAALFAFALGAAPAIMMLSVRVKLPIPYLLFLLMSILLKLGGSLTIIGYLYSL